MSDWYKMAKKEEAKSAVIIKGNPRYVNNNDMAKRFYAEIEKYLKSKGFSVKMDSGKEYTQPPTANLWIGHSRGVDRLRFAPKGTHTLSFGVEGGINHPKDKSLKKGDKPDKYHYIFTDDMKKAIDEL